MLLADYSSYRHMIENQIMLLNEGYDVNEQGNNPDPSPIDGTQRQETLSPEQIQQFPQPIVCRRGSFSTRRSSNSSYVIHIEIPPVLSNINEDENEIDLPMEQYLHLYRTLPVCNN